MPFACQASQANILEFYREKQLAKNSLEFSELSTKGSEIEKMAYSVLGRRTVAEKGRLKTPKLPPQTEWRKKHLLFVI